MSEIASVSDDVSGTNQIATPEDPKEKALQERSPTDDATASELFDSFMEIANDPKLQDNDEASGTLDQSEMMQPSNPGKQADIQNGRLDQSEMMQPSNPGKQSDIQNGTLDQSEMMQPSNPGKLADIQNGTLGQGESTDSQPDSVNKEMNNSANEPTGKTTEQLDIVQTTVTSNPHDTDTDNGSTDEKTSSSTNDDLRKEESVDNQLTAGGDPVPISATDVPMGSSEVVATDAVIDESNAEGLCSLSVELQTSTNSVMANEDERTERQHHETESLEESSRANKKRTGGDHEISDDPKEESTDSAVPPDLKKSVPQKSDPDGSKTEVAQRLSKAMEDLAGLEQLLSSAVSEFKVSATENKLDENDGGGEVNSNAKEDEVPSDTTEERPASGINLIVEREEKSEEDASEVASQDSEELVLSKTDEGAEVPVCKTGKDGTIGETAVATDQLNSAASVETLPKNDEVSSEETASDLLDEQKEVKAGEMENSASTVTLEADLENTSEELGGKTGNRQVENNVQETSESPCQENVSQDDSKVQTVAEESPRKTQIEEFENDTEASLEKPDSADDLDNEVASNAVPDIEITMTDESGISERKSLDSLDTEGSSNSRPASPTASDEGIDSDTPSDYGDDDEDVTFDPESPGSSARRKSWLLETDRDRLSSDSSTVSEKDFKDKYGQEDSADGKSAKKDYIRGHLLKMGGTGLTPKNWRKRWFILRGDNCLYYYKHSKDKMPCGVIIMSNYSVSKAPEINKNHCFKLTKGGARTYYMCAGSDSDMKKWMVALMDAVKESANESNPFNISEGNVHNVSIPALSIRDPDCHGYLYKQGNNYRIWRRCYFVLKNGFLYYYSDMSNTVALGVAKLLDYTVNIGDQSGKKFHFTAVSPDQSSRSYHFAAESEMDRKRWLSRLEDSIKKGSSAH